MVQTFNPLLPLTETATAAINRHRFVGYSGTHAAAAGPALGVSRTGAAIGEDLAVDTLGTALVEASEAIAAGGAVEVGADGKAAALDAGVTVARARTAAAADGDLIEAVLIPS